MFSTFCSSGSPHLCHSQSQHPPNMFRCVRCVTPPVASVAPKPTETPKKPRPSSSTHRPSSHTRRSLPSLRSRSHWATSSPAKSRPHLAQWVFHRSPVHRSFLATVRACKEKRRPVESESVWRSVLGGLLLLLTSLCRRFRRFRLAWYESNTRL